MIISSVVISCFERFKMRLMPKLTKLFFPVCVVYVTGPGKLPVEENLVPGILFILSG